MRPFLALRQLLGTQLRSLHIRGQCVQTSCTSFAALFDRRCGRWLQWLGLAWSMQPGATAQAKPAPIGAA